MIIPKVSKSCFSENSIIVANKMTDVNPPEHGRYIHFHIIIWSNYYSILFFFQNFGFRSRKNMSQFVQRRDKYYRSIQLFEVIWNFVKIIDFLEKINTVLVARRLQSMVSEICNLREFTVKHVSLQSFRTIVKIV